MSSSPLVRGSGRPGGTPLSGDMVQAAVIGGGPAGLTAAIALASSGVSTALVSMRPKPDNRTTALMTGSVAAFRRLGVWSACEAQAAPLLGIRIIDATARLVRAPEVLFEAGEIGLEAFGYNIENQHLIESLEARAAHLPALIRIDEACVAIETAHSRVTVRLESGRSISARLIIGADGRRSICRQAAGIRVTSSGYPQSALTLNLSHSRQHHGISTEFHTESGPFTLVPLPGSRSGLVCVVDPAEAERLAELPDAALSGEVEARAHSILGHMQVEPGRGLFRLGVDTAERFAANRVALIGEAAHVIPPIGAQGLNLGLRDAAVISELVVEASRAARDVGTDDVLMRYHRRRQVDAATRTAAIDLLNRTLLSEFLPAQLLRGAGLYLLGRITPLRRAVMREGVEPALSQPKLMRGEAL